MESASTETWATPFATKELGSYGERHPHFPISLLPANNQAVPICLRHGVLADW